MGTHNLRHMRTLFKNSQQSLKREGFFSDILIRNLREAHHAQEEDSIGSIHPHDEDNTLIVSLLVEDEEPKQCEDFSQRLKESVKEDKKICKQLVDHCKDIHLLIDICALR
jgi:hypothetical protein